MKCTSGLFSLQIESECKSLKFGKSLEVMTIWEEVSCCPPLVDLKHMADHMTDSMTDPMTNPKTKLQSKNQPHYTDLMTHPLIKTLIVTCTMIMIMAKSKKMWFQGSFGLFFSLDFHLSSCFSSLLYHSPDEIYMFELEFHDERKGTDWGFIFEYFEYCVTGFLGKSEASGGKYIET